MLKRGFAVEVLDEPPLPSRHQIERGDESREQPDIADADFRSGQTILRGSFQTEREHFGIGSGLVPAAERLNAELEKFRRRAGTMTKYCAEIAKARRLARGGRLQIGARDRNSEIGAGTFRALADRW